MPAPAYDLITLGDLVVDLVMAIPSLPVRAAEHQVASAFFMEPGGMANVLITAQRIGLRTAALGGLGDDMYGALFRAVLAGEGVDMDGVVEARDKSTSSCVTLVEPGGAHVFLAMRGEAHHCPLADDWEARLRRSRMFYYHGYLLMYPTLVEHAQQMLAVCAAAGIPVFFDPGPMIARFDRADLEVSMRAASVVLLTAGEAGQVVGAESPAEAAVRIMALGPHTVVVKLGADGCYLARPGEAVTVPGFRVPVADMAGAGDAFNAAIAFGYLRGESLKAMGRFANAVGAVAVSKLGTGTRMPTVDEIDTLLASAPRSSP
ncbi:MAG: carbohydrate kinase family protein [Chloroflexi bacterium]|nr:carbohydrate kinase family protein [Chloroflexota bacterium]